MCLSCIIYSDVDRTALAGMVRFFLKWSGLSPVQASVGRYRSGPRSGGGPSARHKLYIDIKLAFHQELI